MAGGKKGRDGCKLKYDCSKSHSLNVLRLKGRRSLLCKLPMPMVSCIMQGCWCWLLWFTESLMTLHVVFFFPLVILENKICEIKRQDVGKWKPIKYHSRRNAHTLQSMSTRSTEHCLQVNPRWFCTAVIESTMKDASTRVAVEGWHVK